MFTSFVFSSQPNTEKEENLSSEVKKKHPRYERIDGRQVCPICAKTLGPKCTMAAHIRIHTGDKPYKCNKCDFSSTNRTSLNRHFARKHLNWNYECKVCSKRHESQELLDEHMKVRHIGDEPYKCKLCTGVEFSNKVTLQKHTEQMHVKKMRCRYCQKPFINQGILRQHETQHENGTIHERVGRKKPYRPKYIKLEEMKIKSEYTCDECDRKVSTSKELLEHLLEHKKEKLA